MRPHPPQAMATTWTDFCPGGARASERNEIASYVEVASANYECPESFDLQARSRDADGKLLGLCFKQFTDWPSSWEHCSLRCKALGVNASLAVLVHDAEYDFLSKVAPHKRYWIGASDFGEEVSEAMSTNLVGARFTSEEP